MKSILPAVPFALYAGEPIRTARVADGWVVYSVGPDGQDNGGKLDPSLNESQSGFDWGCRLWDVDHRRQPPGSKTKPEPKP